MCVIIPSPSLQGKPRGDSEDDHTAGHKTIQSSERVFNFTASSHVPCEAKWENFQSQAQNHLSPEPEAPERWGQKSAGVGVAPL